jgi:GDP-4-dehydro-6-deoxy-D-mannose reductase
VTGLSRSSDRWLDVDLLDAGATTAAVRDVRPDVVYHLAALASVGRSWQEPVAVLTDNMAMSLNLLEAVRGEMPTARVVIGSSGEIYGPPAALPVAEDAPLRPQNPYAVSKAGTDLLGGLYADAHGLHVVRARAFNHAGPGQTETFVVGSFARQVAQGLAAGQAEIALVTGNPEARRDFTDVRDVVRAYRLLAHAPVGVYNVASGVSRSARDVVAALEQVTGVRIVASVDPALVRVHEVAEIRGSHERLTAATGWAPEIPFEATLGDAVAWWRERLASAAA